MLTKVIILITLLNMACLGHYSWQMHYDDISCIFNGYGDDNFTALFHKVSSGIDNELPAQFRALIGSVPGNHRILGHGWALNDKIPEETLKYLESVYPGKKVEIIRIWQKFANGINAEAIRLTGLPPKQAHALASLFYNFHLLGDLEPDNTLINNVLDYRSIIRNIDSDVDILFGTNSKYAKLIHKHLAKYLKKGLDPQIAAQSAMSELYSLRLGTMVNSSYGKILKMNYSIDRVTNANMKIASRPLTKIYGITKVPDTAHNIMQKGNVKFVKGVLQEHRVKGKIVHTLSVPISPALKAGLTVGVLTLVISEGQTIYQFSCGNITEEEFLKESAKNCADSIVLGSTTYVLVALGMNPTGWAVIGAGITASLVYEISFDYVCDKFATPVLSLDDIVGRLPVDIQRRKTYFDTTGYDSFVEGNKKQSSQLLPSVQQKNSALDYYYQNNSFINFKPPQKTFFDGSSN